MASTTSPLPPRLVEALGAQAKACAELGSNFSALLCALLARDGVPDGPVSRVLHELTNAHVDIGPAGASLPLRLIGSLHRLVLDGTDPVLAAAYPPAMHPGESALASALTDAFSKHGERIAEFLQSAPQTNETGRSAVLAPALALLAARYELPFKLSELGASAGLNLNWPLYKIDYGQWSIGPGDSTLKIGVRWHGPTFDAVAMAVDDAKGCDLHPMPLETDEQRNAMLAYVWPDQPDRLARMRAALAIAQERTPVVVPMDAACFVAERLAQPSPGLCHMVYHTIAWQYFPGNQQKAAQEAIEAAGEQATSDAPLAWLRFESDKQAGGKGAKLDMVVWDGTSPSGQHYELARADFHGRWVHWTAGKTLEQ
ncbi:MAG: DUF2332 family protein [Pseudomonadota bacterium]